MVDMTPAAKQVYEAMLKLGASSEDSMKSADQIMAAARLGKGLVASALTELERLKIVARKAREKRAGYYVAQKVA